MGLTWAECGIGGFQVGMGPEWVCTCVVTGSHLGSQIDPIITAHLNLTLVLSKPHLLCKAQMRPMCRPSIPDLGGHPYAQPVRLNIQHHDWVPSFSAPIHQPRDDQHHTRSVEGRVCYLPTPVRVWPVVLLLLMSIKLMNQVLGCQVFASPEIVL